MSLSGAEITHDLIQLLQKRLDDAVLNEIILTLSRNPMYKLSPEDVQVSEHRECELKSYLTRRCHLHRHRHILLACLLRYERKRCIVL